MRAVLIALAATLGAAAPALAADPTTLTLTAAGETRLAPDMASVTLGVAATAATAAEAMKQDAAQMARVIAALRRLGVAERDIQTAGFNVQAQYAFPPNQQRQLTGYQASNQVSVTVRELDRLGAVLDGVAAGGANEINGVGFGLKDPGAAEDAARLKAVAALKAKADLYARATGYTLGRLVNLSEGGGYTPGPVRPMALMTASKRVETPVEAGELGVRIEVSGVYEMAR
ncbi:MAG: hypothetical protein JWO72_773 [Caulobacteraceae bacterium]|jgi:uncharacterized protein YggE|nr:hypothetical protein [Caulobacteraceae bacterium]